MQRYDLFFNSQNIWRIYSSLVYSIYYILKMINNQVMNTTDKGL